MPLIEELPVTASHARASHGWTYIADPVAPTSAAHLGSRKRGRDGNVAAAQAAHKFTAKQEKAIQQRLNDLGKENHREANIPVPKREGGRGKPHKTTQNVRRILAYSRTFQHYLADEEAGVNVYGSAGNVAASTTGPQVGSGQAQKTAESRKRGSVVDPPSVQKGTSSRTSSVKRAVGRPRKSTTGPIKSETRGAADGDNDDVVMTDAPAQTSPLTTSPSQKSPQQKQPPAPSETPPAPPAPSYDPSLDRDPLLRTRDIPKMPSDRVMQALLAEPPLSFIAARAKPLDGANSSSFALRIGSSAGLAKPQRWFCAVCGHWGKVRCGRGCGERVCGLLECWRGHEGVCPLATY